jgi:hypothetical protein
MMPPKPYWQSTTLWFNAAAALLTVSVPRRYLRVLLGCVIVGNVVQRFRTAGPITINIAGTQFLGSAQIEAMAGGNIAAITDDDPLRGGTL